MDELRGFAYLCDKSNMRSGVPRKLMSYFGIVLSQLGSCKTIIFNCVHTCTRSVGQVIKAGQRYILSIYPIPEFANREFVMFCSSGKMAIDTDHKADKEAQNV